MRILALVKYSLDAAEIRVDPASGALRLANVPQRFGDIDKNVIEAAVRIKEATDGRVRVLCLGAQGAVTGLKSVMAMGVDDAVIVRDPFDGEADGGMAARVLEAAVRTDGPWDLVVCGFASDDGYTWQVGPRLAERLGLPLVSYARYVRVHGEDGVLEVNQDFGDRVRTVRVSLPAILAVAEESFAPRPITLLEAVKAQKRPVSVVDVEADLGLSVHALEAARGFAGVSRRGVVVPRRAIVLESADVAGLADRLIDALIEENVLVEGG
jgi:electron transfer flavoprotein beta subunit